MVEGDKSSRLTSRWFWPATGPYLQPWSTVDSRDNKFLNNKVFRRTTKIFFSPVKVFVMYTVFMKKNLVVQVSKPPNVKQIFASLLAHHYNNKGPLCLLLINFLADSTYLSIPCSIYYADDDDYQYKIEICRNKKEKVAVGQLGKNWKRKSWLAIGNYDGAHVTGGSKYYCFSMLMIWPVKLEICMLPMALTKLCVALKLSPARWDKKLNGIVRRGFLSFPHTATSCDCLPRV